LPSRLRTRALRAAWRAAVVALIVAASPAPAAYHALEEIPVESAVYRLVDDLATTWGHGGAFLATRPWDRADLGRFLDELVASEPAAAGDPAVIRLRRELESGARPGGWEPALQNEGDASSLELSAYGRADFAEDRARGTVVRDFRAGAQASLALGDGLLLWSDVYAGTQSPGPHGNPVRSERFGLIEGVRVNSYFDRATFAARHRLGRVRVGHTWLRWGPGAWGTLGLSDGAPAMDLAEFRVPVGRGMQLAWFVASLDPVAETFLAGHRLEIRPGPSVDLSLAELARFDGTSNAPAYLVPVIPYSLMEKRVIHSSALASDTLERLIKNNVMWQMDVAWRWRPGARLYGELVVDDISFSSEKRPRAVGWQVGAEMRRVRGGGAWTARAEYARVYQYTYSVFHGHDFAHAGLPTGFFLGPDVELLAGRLEWRRDAAWTFALEGSATRKGEGALGQFYLPGSGRVNNLVLTGVLDQDARGAVAADWSPSPSLHLGITAGFASVKALGHEIGRDESGPYGSTRGTIRW
jgi:hypothetical protein